MNVLVFLAWGTASQDPATLDWMQDQFTVSLGGIQQLRLWTLLTSAVSHYQPMHLAFNLYAFWIFSRPLLRALGWRAVVSLYVVGGIVASIGHVSYNYFASNDVPALGASGSVMALGVVFAALFPKVRLALFFLFPMTARTAFAAFFVIDVLGMVGGAGGIAHAAHIGGAVYGSVYYWLALRPRLMRRGG